MGVLISVARIEHPRAADLRHIQLGFDLERRVRRANTRAVPVEPRSGVSIDGTFAVEERQGICHWSAPRLRIARGRPLGRARSSSPAMMPFIVAAYPVSAVM